MDKRAQKTLFASEKSDWATPQWLYDLLDEEFAFGLDAAAQDAETDEEWAARCAKAGIALPRQVANWKHPNFLSEARSAFYVDWHREAGGKAAFLNPPYGRAITHWMALAKRWGEKMVVAALVPARTDTNWFWDSVLDGAQQIRLIRGRLRFEGGGAATAPFPSAVIVYGPRLVGMPSRQAEIVGWDPPRPSSVAATSVDD